MGYAALIEYGGKRILFDMGNNPDILAENVKVKAIDLTKVDFVVMSHRHGDHMGGLSYLLRVNPRVVIYAPKKVLAYMAQFATPEGQGDDEKETMGKCSQRE